MLTRRAWLIGVAPAMLAGCGEGAALDRLAQGPRVLATGAPTGDRLSIQGGPEVLLAGVQAPAPNLPHGETARRTLERFCKGRTVELLYAGGDPERSGRPAQVRLAAGRRWVEGALLGDGCVWVRTAADDRALAREMLAIEARARTARRGLWSLPEYDVRLPDEVEPGEHGFRIVEGRVLRAGRFGRTLFLDFARPWRAAVSVHIPSSALRDFRSAGLDPESLEGKPVRVRGVVATDQGAPVLTLDHPEAVERLRS